MKKSALTPAHTPRGWAEGVPRLGKIKGLDLQWFRVSVSKLAR